MGPATVKTTSPEGVPVAVVTAVIGGPVLVAVVRDLSEAGMVAKPIPPYAGLAAPTAGEVLEVHSLDNEKVFAVADNVDGGMSANQIEQKSKVAMVNGAIALLSPDDAQVITLFYKGEQTLEEIAQALGIDLDAGQLHLDQHMRQRPLGRRRGADAGMRPARRPRGAAGGLPRHPAHAGAPERVQGRTRPARPPSSECPRPASRPCCGP